MESAPALTSAAPETVVTPALSEVESSETPAVQAAAPGAAETTAAIPAPPVAVVDLPWEEQLTQDELNTPAAESPGETPVQPVPVSEPVQSQTEATATEAIDKALLVDADSDDEPPLGDYDYVEMDAESFDYDFAGVEPTLPAEPEPLPAAQAATGLAADWLELFPKLGLSGMTGSIGANCSLIAVEGDSWLLHLDPGHSALFNATQQRRLNDALNQYHGRELSLQVELCKPEQETPAQAAARKRANRQREAEASIHNDPLVQQMIQQFAAVVRADSIEPIETAVNP